MRKPVLAGKTAIESRKPSWARFQWDGYGFCEQRHHAPPKQAIGRRPARRWAAEELAPLIYEQLRLIAARRLRNERPDHTLQATALVHEAYVKLAGQRGARWQNRAQFFAVASQAMRRILVDYARTRRRTKRGGNQVRVTFDDVSIASPQISEEILAVDESLTRLENFDSRLARIVELRYFAGLTTEQAAEALGISAKTVTREWKVAKAWLLAELKESSPW
jgi:RNA polymerase sigma-70 factor, ECF subfamily